MKVLSKFRAAAAGAALCGWVFAAHAGTITLGSGCSLAQAINAANIANMPSGATPAVYGSATDTGSCSGATTNSSADSTNTILITNTPTIPLTSIDNYWYGPNALPPIASSIEIDGGGTTLIAQHTGDPTPATANAFRFFYVSGGMELPAGSLTLYDLVLQGGYAKGGDAGIGGGGAGLGGGIFNQGSLTLQSVSLIGNSAVGGTVGGGLRGGGGGMGQDSGVPLYGGWDGGGFGGSLGAAYGGAGAAPSVQGGGGGGGFLSGSDGMSGGSPYGGGNGGLGGWVGVSEGYGDGGDGGAARGTSGGTVGAGGSFGSGGKGEPNVCPTCGAGGGGGGIGGGGGQGGKINNSYGGCGGGGGFGGGGGATYASTGDPAASIMAMCGAGGGFGGGSGRNLSGAYPGFGAGGWAGGQNGSGAGMGGAIFNHTGTVTLLNVTATGNAARGGSVTISCNPGCTGSGLGAVLFNLNGVVTIDFSTLTGNSLSGTNAQPDISGPEDGTVYSLAYDYKIQDRTASSASLTINNSIIFGTAADAGTNGNDVVANGEVGAWSVAANTSNLIYSGANIVQYSHAAGAYVVSSGSGTISASDPLLGSLTVYPSYPNPLLPVFPLTMNSPAHNGAANCLEADGSTLLRTDERGAPRPSNGPCDIGADEFDDIFANGFE